jgi:hypothetical protein
MAFATAKKIGTPAKTTKAKAERECIELPNIEQLAHLHAIVKAATGAIKAIEGTLKEDVLNIFMQRIAGDGQKPSSIDAAEGLALVNLQFRKRATTSPLSDDELRTMAHAAGCILKDDADVDTIVAALAKKNLVVGENIKTQKLFAIDPTFAADEKLMTKVEAVLKKNGLDHIITVQDEVKTLVVTDGLLAEACRTKKPAIITPCTVLAFKPTLSEVRPADLAKTMAEVLDIDMKSKGDEKQFADTVIAKAKARSKKIPSLLTA